MSRPVVTLLTSWQRFLRCEACGLVSAVPRETAPQGGRQTRCQNAGRAGRRMREHVPYVGPGPMRGGAARMRALTGTACGHGELDVPERRRLDTLVRTLRSESLPSHPNADLRRGRGESSPDRRILTATRRRRRHSVVTAAAEVASSVRPRTYTNRLHVPLVDTASDGDKQIALVRRRQTPCWRPSPEPGLTGCRSRVRLIAILNAEPCRAQRAPQRVDGHCRRRRCRSHHRECEDHSRADCTWGSIAANLQRPYPLAAHVSTSSCV